jgi:hypothetical protein
MKNEKFFISRAPLRFSRSNLLHRVSYLVNNSISLMNKQILRSVLLCSVTSLASATQCLLVFGFVSHIYRYAVFSNSRQEICFVFLSVSVFRDGFKKNTGLT